MSYVEPDPPLPLPEGANWERDYLLMKINEGKWRHCERYYCRTCYGDAFLHPYANTIWGCKTCGYTTASPSVYFADKTAVPLEGRQ